MFVEILFSCGGNSNEGKEETLARLKGLDSLVRAQLDVSSDAAFICIDSLQKTGQLSPAFISYYRGVVYNRLEQKATAELYYKKALESTELQTGYPELFYKASDNLSGILENRGEHAEALAVATRCYEVSYHDNSPEGRRWTAVILHAMGYFQTQLGMKDEAEKNFSMSYMALSQMAKANGSYENRLTYARVSYNILDAYTTTAQYEKASEWVTAAEDAANLLAASPECPEEDSVMYLGGVGIHKALVKLKLGDRRAAELSYEKARDLGHFNDPYGIMDQAYFLRQAERWDELADLMPKVDSLAKFWNVPMSLLYLREYVVPQFNAYTKSGRIEKAQEMAELMAASMDSVASYELNHKMKEIAVISERKDQNTEMVKQELQEANKRVRILAWSLALVVLAAFVFIIYYFADRKKKK